MMIPLTQITEFLTSSSSHFRTSFLRTTAWGISYVAVQFPLGELGFSEIATTVVWILRLFSAFRKISSDVIVVDVLIIFDEGFERQVTFFQSCIVTFPYFISYSIVYI